jgi:AbrB family looped-hinge helix DNA binding protein
METAYVTNKGRLIIPAKIRRKLGVKPGTKICFVEREHEVLFQPLTKEHIRNLGMLRSSTSATAELLKERKLDKKREDKKFARRRAR